MEERPTLFRVTTPPMLKSHARKKLSVSEEEMGKTKLRFENGDENQNQNQTNTRNYFTSISTPQNIRHVPVAATITDTRTPVNSFARGVIRTSTLADQERMLREGLDVDDMRYGDMGKGFRENIGHNTLGVLKNSNTNTGSAFLPTFSRESSMGCGSKSNNSIRRKVLSPRTAAIPESRVDNASRTQKEDEASNIYFFQSGIMYNEVVDAAQFPPVYKTQYTVTGRTIKRKEPPPAYYPKTMGTQIELNGKSLALFRYNLKFYALENKCCHQGASLSQGEIEDVEELVSPCSAETKKVLCVACPRHHWKFELNTGRCINQESFTQPVFPCKVDGDTGEVLVGFRNFNQDQFEARRHNTIQHKPTVANYSRLTCDA